MPDLVLHVCLPKLPAADFNHNHADGEVKCPAQEWQQKRLSVFITPGEFCQPKVNPVLKNVNNSAGAAIAKRGKIET
jgi:hypothetical protein